MRCNGRYQHNRHYSVVCGLVFVLLAAAIAGCGGGNPTPLQPETTRFAPGGVTATIGDTTSGFQLPEIVVDPATCGRRELEEWLQRSGSLVAEYTDVVNRSIATPPEQMTNTLDQLGTLEGSLSALPFPQCAAIQRDLIASSMIATSSLLNNYSRGEQVDLTAMIIDMNTAFTNVRALEAQLNEIYNSLPR